MIIAPLVLIGGLCLALTFTTEDKMMRMGLILTSCAMFAAALDVALHGNLTVSVPFIAAALVPMALSSLYGLAVDPA